MEGPYVSQKFRLSDLIESKQVVLPESRVTYIEGGGKPAQMNSVPATMGDSTQPATTGRPPGLVDAGTRPRQLYWFKGIKLEVLDENDKPMPTAEFICHLNMDVDMASRNRLFTEGERCRNNRIVTLTQGQTEFYFPDGFAVPAASDEQWSITFQAANRTTDQHRRIKHRCRLYFIRDVELIYPVKALSWFVPYVQVIVDKDTREAALAAHQEHPDCLAMSPGVSAPNSVPGSNRQDSLGRRVSGHWVVPPGVHTYSSPLTEEREPAFGTKDRRIHAVWTHVHPLCTKAAIVKCDAAGQQKILEAKSRTRTAGGLEIVNIETIYSKEGILLPSGKHYELTGTYENKLDQPQDSMIVMGIFCADDTFARPQWWSDSDKRKPAFCGVTFLESGDAAEKKEGASCSIKAAASPTEPRAADNINNRFPLFDLKADGPLITETKNIELETNLGRIHLALDPRLAPMHATQMYRLMNSGAFDGTPIFRYSPNFVLQVATAERKADGQPALSERSRAMLRRLPLEVATQPNGELSHKRWTLSMARYDQTDSAVSSFSILLGDAPHLDHQYTIFGHLVPDSITLQTIENITRNWSHTRPWIVGTREVTNSIAARAPQPAEKPLTEPAGKTSAAPRPDRLTK
jgi:cyclophilin family peptidyl-prolyl cis-trans isomerase